MAQPLTLGDVLEEFQEVQWQDAAPNEAEPSLSGSSELAAERGSASSDPQDDGAQRPGTSGDGQGVAPQQSQLHTDSKSDERHCDAAHRPGVDGTSMATGGHTDEDSSGARGEAMMDAAARRDEAARGALHEMAATNGGAGRDWDCDAELVGEGSVSDNAVDSAGAGSTSDSDVENDGVMKFGYRSSDAERDVEYSRLAERPVQYRYPLRRRAYKDHGTFAQPYAQGQMALQIRRTIVEMDTGGSREHKAASAVKLIGMLTRMVRPLYNARAALLILVPALERNLEYISTDRLVKCGRELEEMYPSNEDVSLALVRLVEKKSCPFDAMLMLNRMIENDPSPCTPRTEAYCGLLNFKDWMMQAGVEELRADGTAFDARPHLSPYDLPARTDDASADEQRVAADADARLRTAIAYLSSAVKRMQYEVDAHPYMLPLLVVRVPLHGDEQLGMNRHWVSEVGMVEGIKNAWGMTVPQSLVANEEEWRARTTLQRYVEKNSSFLPAQVYVRVPRFMWREGHLHCMASVADRAYHSRSAVCVECTSPLAVTSAIEEVFRLDPHNVAAVSAAVHLCIGRGFDTHEAVALLEQYLGGGVSVWLDDYHERSMLAEITRSWRSAPTAGSHATGDECTRGIDTEASDGMSTPPRKRTRVRAGLEDGTMASKRQRVNKLLWPAEEERGDE